jgi:glycosyltransferase involved in cell wall biosynthesis
MVIGMDKCMKEQPLVSVIVIFFNAQPYIEETIQSILNQTYPHWELLLVDDGSTDGSTEVALKYASQHPEQISYHEHEGHQNRGMSATRNLGICQAKGTYLTFLDADDLWLPHTLMDQVHLIEPYPEAAMVYGPIQWWYSWTGQPNDAARDFVDRSGLETDGLVEPPTLFLLLLQQEIAIAGMLLRKQVVDQVGGFDEKFRGLYEDQVFCSKICLQYPVFVSSQWWYKYRQHPRSCCSIAEKMGQEGPARQVFLQWVKQYIAEQQIQTAEVQRALNRELLLANYPVVFPFLRPRAFLFVLGRRILPAFIRRWLWIRWVRVIDSFQLRSQPNLSRNGMR